MGPVAEVAEPGFERGAVVFFDCGARGFDAGEAWLGGEGGLVC